MNADSLITMANQIGAFFETMPDRHQALTDIARHLKSFWEPRMRRSLLQYVDEHGGGGLKVIVLDAVQMHRAAIL
ncbi:formate dehydrogenase delta subunit [Collimonas sp. OK242]|jgi:formate dehydrogenase subunit delta|uniref:formate dehydrogenase subunit delta n=1 Tax=Collimonas sp. OK242 TaxID=1798195 RepID=UPI00089B4312|nr:formate dehydrogenase subunit delta [Collimonas sp. OK242]SDY90499.1 formate dehydrogenase delta subunit [Collimonas sp. OK242]